MKLLAEMTVGNATNAQIGLWVVIAFACASGIGALVSLASYFATRRELEGAIKRIEKLEEQDGTIRESMRSMKDDLVLSGDRRSSVLHNRINPIVETLAALKGSNEAFMESFRGFIKILEQQKKH